MKKLDMLEIMDAADKMGASDIHLAPGRPPAFRNAGVMLVQDEYPVITPEESDRMLSEIMSEEQRLKLDRDWETDFSYELDLGGHHVRFRVNVHQQNRGLAAVFRLIPDKIFSAEQIGLEEALIKLTHLPRGLVLVTGPTGSGKSTTLATMIDMINKREKLHILTIEDPIEFVHPEQNCVVTQRELNEHTKSFENALRSAMREDPDVILVGEMRDPETIGLALTAAETGHLVFATLHTTDAAQTVDRIIDVFPAEQQSMVRTQLSSVLQAVVCQVLLPRIDGKGGKRVAAREILLRNTAIATLIRDSQSQKIYPTMAVNIALGMCPLELSLAVKIKQGIIDENDAFSKANDATALRSYLDAKTIPGMAPAGGAATPPRPAHIKESPPPPKRRSLWGG